MTRARVEGEAREVPRHRVPGDEISPDTAYQIVRPPASRVAAQPASGGFAPGASKIS